MNVNGRFLLLIIALICAILATIGVSALTLHLGWAAFALYLIAELIGS